MVNQPIRTCQRPTRGLQVAKRPRRPLITSYITIFSSASRAQLRDTLGHGPKSTQHVLGGALSERSQNTLRTVHISFRTVHFRSSFCELAQYIIRRSFIIRFVQSLVGISTHAPGCNVQNVYSTYCTLHRGTCAENNSVYRKTRKTGTGTP